MTKRLLIMAGGTGGHVFPGLAVATLLAQKQWQIHWLGTQGRMEAEIVPKAGFAISFIDVVGVRNNGLLKLLAAPFKVTKSVFQARSVIRSFKPDVVLGMGGFASGPGGVAAWLSRIPLIVHEQNAAPGLTNRWLAHIASKVLTGFAHTFKKQTQSNQQFEWVGNPVRLDFANIAPKTDLRLPLNILIVGGSLGAQVLNETVPLALANLQNVQVRHQTGKGHLSAVTALYQFHCANTSNWIISEFIEDMPAAYSWADLVICRAGALTVAEVAAAGVAAIFVPLPHAVDDHQTKNAQSLVTEGAAYLLPQAELTSETLKLLILQCISQPKKLIEMSQKAKNLARLNATEMVAQRCEEMAGKNK